MSFKISVITVCRNIASKIVRTLESISNQTFKDFEWIVVDGNSDDGTYEIILKYASRINTLIHEPDSGIYNAMNKGIMQAHSEYLLFLNGGDELYNADVLDNAVRNGLNSDIVYGDVIIKNDNDEILAKNHNRLSKKSLYKYTIYHPSAFIKTELLKKYLYDESFKIAADYDFFTKVFLKKYRFKKIDIVVSTFYLDGISATNLSVVEQEKERIRAKYFSKIQRCIYDSKLIETLFFCKMAITHPRYIAGWIKRKLCKH